MNSNREITSVRPAHSFDEIRLAAIVQGVYKRGLDGIASSDHARTYGEYVRFLTDSACQVISKNKPR